MNAFIEIVLVRPGERRRLRWTGKQGQVSSKVCLQRKHLHAIIVKVNKMAAITTAILPFG